MRRSSMLFVVALPLAMLMLTQQTPPRIRGTIDLTIGGADNAAKEYTFGSVSGLTLGADGRIFVADGQDNQIRVYGADGKYQFSIGNKGAGPGEFSGLAAIAFGPDGMLWARDEGNSRFEAFSVGATSATYKTLVRIPQSAIGTHQPITFDAKGNLVDRKRTNSAKGQVDVIYTLNLQGNVVTTDTIPSTPVDSLGMRTVTMKIDSATTAMRYFYQPYGATSVVAFGPRGEWAKGITSRYAITWHTAAAPNTRVLQRSIEGPALTADEKSKAQTTLEQTARSMKLLDADVPFRVPARKPIFSAIQFSLDGDLWVQRHVAQGQPREADIYDRAGKFVAIAEWPADLNLLVYSSAILGRTGLAVARDSLDTERVVRVRFR